LYAPLSIRNLSKIAQLTFPRAPNAQSAASRQHRLHQNSKGRGRWKGAGNIRMMATFLKLLLNKMDNRPESVKNKKEEAAN
jgi:hypothetical protein